MDRYWNRIVIVGPVLPGIGILVYLLKEIVCPFLAHILDTTPYSYCQPLMLSLLNKVNNLKMCKGLGNYKNHFVDCREKRKVF